MVNIYRMIRGLNSLVHDPDGASRVCGSNKDRAPEIVTADNL
jgi:hypothetical protein